MTTKGKLDDNYGIFIKLLDYRDINTEKIAETAYNNKVFFPCELYRDASSDIVKAMLELVKQDEIDEGLAGVLLLCLEKRFSKYFWSLKDIRENGGRSYM